MAMGTPAQMLRKLEQLDPYQELTEAVEQTATDAANLNKAQLYQQGVKADGSQLKPYRNKRYAIFKNNRNPLPGFGQPDLFLSGRTQEALTVTVEGSGQSAKAVFMSSSVAAPFLLKRDGPAIFGLTDDSKEQYAAIYMPLVREQIRRKTGLK